jgi:hypothetical protein
MLGQIWACISHDQARPGSRSWAYTPSFGEPAEILDVGEDRIMSDEWNAQPDRGRGYPAVRFCSRCPNPWPTLMHQAGNLRRRFLKVPFVEAELKPDDFGEEITASRHEFAELTAAAVSSFAVRSCQRA